jgi:hypothetical protein
VSEPWEDEGFGAENDWGEESLEPDLEEDVLDSVGPVEEDPPDDDDLDDED